MEIILKTKHYVAIGIGLLIIILDFFLFWGNWYFNPIFVIALLIGGILFLLDFMAETDRQKEIEEKFLEFVRGLVEEVRSGISMPIAVRTISKTDLGALTPYLHKMANQIEWGYSMNEALVIFAKDTNNEVIKRSIGIVMQAQRSGGDVAAILESIANSVHQIKQLKEEQKTGAYNQVVQGYIIFVIFIAIMLMMKIYMIPKLTEVGAEMAGNLAGGLGVGGGGKPGKAADLGSIFLGTVIVQGIFAGLMIGKFSEGKFQGGVKHSVIMVVSAYLIMSTVSGLFLGTVKAPLFLILPYKELFGSMKKCLETRKV